MKRYPLFGILFVPLLVLMTAAPGCGKKQKAVDEDETPVPSTSKFGQATTPAKAGAKQAITAGDGVITGKVVFSGDIPEPKLIAAMKEHKDKDVCLSPTASESEKSDQTWIIDKSNKGVANVLIYLKTPADKYFAPNDADKNRKDTVALDQPHCNFVPHVLAVFPSYFDGKKQQASGQKFVIKNSAPVPHNSSVQGDPAKNPQMNPIINPGDQVTIDLKYQGKDPVRVSCSFHPWMNALVYTFDHPYVAVTKDDGSFEIRNVPTGTQFELIASHESKPNFFSKNMTFTSGENKLDISVAP